jgi:outer membrane protein assembly factor BamB
MKDLLFLSAALAFLPLAQAQNWPSFRGPNASGIAEGAKPPVTWNAESSENIRWKTAIPGLAHSSPIIWHDRVFVTTAISSDPNSVFRPGLYGDVDSAEDESKHSWRVYCLDKNSGKILWEHIAWEGVPTIKRHIKASHASSTPVTDGKHLVAFFGSEGLFCYDFDGNLLWKQKLGRLDAGWFHTPEYQWGNGSSPIIYKDLVIVQCDIQEGSFIAAYHLKDGQEAWRTERDEYPSWGTPTVYEGPGRITNGSKAIRGYDPLTGEELWQLRPNSDITTPTPFVAHDLIFVTSGYRPVQPIYAIRPGARGDISLNPGQESNEYIAWSKRFGGPYTPTPIVHGDLLYVCSNSSVLTTYNAKTGERIYQERIGKDPGAYTASPVAADGKIYFSSEEGIIHVLKAGPIYELLASNPMGEVCMATPAISGEMILIRTQHHLFAIGAAPDK